MENDPYLLIAAGMVVLTVCLFAVCLITNQKRKHFDKNSAVQLPFFMAVIGAVCGGFMCIPMVFSALDQEDPGMSLFFAAFVLLSDSMMIAYKNCLIRYDSEGFLARNFLGIKRQCRYGDVEGVRTGKDNRVFFQGHFVMIDEACYGKYDFLHTLERGYKTQTGKRLPSGISFKRKWDPMNGHVDYPWFYLGLWLSLMALCAALPILMVVSMTAENDPAEIEVYTEVFSRYEIDDGSLLLYPEGKDTCYIIDYYEAYGEGLPSPEVLCNGDYYQVGVKAGRQYVKSLTGINGARYITPESERQVYRDTQKGAVVLLCILSLAGMVFCWFGIQVTRHPERYSDKVRRMYYKNGILH